jgi:hypothetical protein
VKIFPEMERGLPANALSWTLTNSWAASGDDTTTIPFTPSFRYMMGPWILDMCHKLWCTFSPIWCMLPMIGSRRGPGGSFMWRLLLSKLRNNEIVMSVTATATRIRLVVHHAGSLSCDKSELARSEALPHLEAISMAGRSNRTTWNLYLNLQTSTSAKLISH